MAFVVFFLATSTGSPDIEDENTLPVNFSPEKITIIVREKTLELTPQEFEDLKEMLCRKCGEI